MRAGDGTGMSNNGIPISEGDAFMNEQKPESPASPYGSGGAGQGKGSELCKEGMDNNRSSPLRESGKS